MSINSAPTSSLLPSSCAYAFLPWPLKHSRHPTSAGRLSSSFFLVAGTLRTSLRLFLKSLSWKRTSFFAKTYQSIGEWIADDEIVTNIPLPPQDKDPFETIWQGSLTFDPSPPLDEGEDIQLANANEQAKLMQWHYHLGHLSFPKLKQLALNSEIPKNSQRLHRPSVLVASLAQWPSFPGKARRPRLPPRSSLQPNQESAPLSTKWNQLNWDFMCN